MTAGRLKRFAVLAALVAAALVVSHELIYLLAHPGGAEYARAMRDRGHDRYWTTLVLTVAIVVTALGVIALGQLHRLRRAVSQVRSGRAAVDDLALGTFGRIAGGLWLRVSVGTIVAFLAQENLEAAGAGASPSGLGVILGDHVIALPVIALASAVVALVGALVRWGREVMLARLCRSAVSPRRRMPRMARPVGARRPASTRAVRQHGLRAPPPLEAVPV